MSSQDTSQEEIPLIETSEGSPAHDLLAGDRDPESDEMYRSIWADFRDQLPMRLEALGSLTDPKLLKAELHSLRGMSAQFGLFLLEVYLFSWEVKTSNPVAETPRFLPGASVIARRSLEALEQVFPYLKASS